MRWSALVCTAIVALFVSEAHAQTATAIRNGRIDRTIDVKDFDDFEFYLPDTTTELAIYAQWSNGSVVVLDDITLLCVSGPDGLAGTEEEDDDLTFGNSRQTSYKVVPGRMWYTTTVSGQRCWIQLDFQDKDQYDRSAQARFTIIMSETGATEGTWNSASAFDLQMMREKKLATGAVVEGP